MYVETLVLSIRQTVAKVPLAHPLTGGREAHASVFCALLAAFRGPSADPGRLRESGDIPLAVKMTARYWA